VHCSSCAAETEVCTSKYERTGKKGRPQAEINKLVVGSGRMAGVNQGKQEQMFGMLGVKGLVSPKDHSRLSLQTAKAMIEAGTEATRAACKKLRDQLIAEGAEVEKVVYQEKQYELVRCIVAGNASWHTRGSGRSYASRSGEFCFISVDTGEVVYIQGFNRNCSKCDALRKNGRDPRSVPHDCFKNFDGSAKAMEAEGAVRGVLELPNFGLKVHAIVGDEDSAMIAKCNDPSRVPAHLLPIGKMSDPNHMKKLVFGDFVAEKARIWKSDRDKFSNRLDKNFDRS
jgi:hypothetical protein